MNGPTLLVSGRYLLPNAAQSSVLPNSCIAITDDTITAIGPTEDLVAQYPEANRLHTENGLLMPGLINTHTHAPMACFRGLADDLPLMTWLEEHIFPVETNLTKEIVHLSAQLSIAEMVKSGTTSFCDMYLFSKEVARAVASSGIRAWVGEVLYDFPSPCYGEVENGYRYMEELAAEYIDHPLVSITVDPHSVYTCSPELLTKLGQIAADRNAILHTHLSENAQEVATCLERYGVRPVAHLGNLGLLSEKTLAAHCVMLTADEIELLAAKKVKVSHCLESNMKLASGIAPVVEMLDNGITVSIGTDGSASNNDVDLFGEMSSVAKVHKATRLDPTVMSAETTLHTATIGGAEALGAESMIGTLEVGKKADLIVLDFDQPHLTPCYNPVSHLVYAARGGDVLHSLVNGKIVMENRQLTTLNEGDLLARMNELGQRIRTMR